MPVVNSHQNTILKKSFVLECREFNTQTSDVVIDPYVGWSWTNGWTKGNFIDLTSVRARLKEFPTLYQGAW